MLPTVKCFGIEVGFNLSKPIQSKVVAFHKIFSPITKLEQMSFLSSMNVYCKIFDKLHVILKHL